MDRNRKRSLTRVKSPAGRKSSAGKSPARPKSKAGSQQTKKDAKTRARSKSRSKKESRSRSRARAKSKSPKPRARSRTRRSSSRSRGSSVNKKIENPEIQVEPDVFASIGDRKVNLVLKDLYHDDYLVSDNVYKDMVRRSISRDISEEKTISVNRRYPSLVREESEKKEVDGLLKDAPTSITNIKLSTVPEKKRAFKFNIPKWLTASLFMLCLPPFILLLHLACTKEQCTLTKFHIHRNLNLYFNLQSAGIVVGFITFQALLSMLRIGKKVGGPFGINGTLLYCCNGLLSTFISVGIVAALWHYKYPVHIVNEKMISMIVSSSIFAFLLGLVLFIKGGRAPVPATNPDVINCNRLYQFIVGREINPVLFGRINIKTLLLRVSLNALVIINGLLLLKTYEAKSELNATLTTAVILSSLLVIDFFWFEDSFPSTFEAMYEGTGCYLIMSYMLYPFFPTLITKFIIQHRIKVPLYGLMAIITFFIIGFYIYRASNLQKAAFRRNPLNPALAHFETISTSRGKKLLVAGWWGFVRHPNYLGSIILHWSWASTAGYTHVIPYIFPFVISLILISRARRVDAHCKVRYQTAWDEYCRRVPQRIIPRIF